MGNETQHLYQCPYCTYIFFKYPSKETNEAESLANEKEREDPNLREAQSPPTEMDNKPPEDVHFTACPRCRSYINLKDLPQKENSEHHA